MTCGHFPPLLSAHGVLTPVQVCALRTQRMLEVDGVPWSALEALVQASYYHPQQNPDAVGYGQYDGPPLPRLAIVIPLCPLYLNIRLSHNGRRA